MTVLVSHGCVAGVTTRLMQMQSVRGSILVTWDVKLEKNANGRLVVFQLLSEIAEEVDSGYLFVLYSMKDSVPRVDMLNLKGGMAFGEEKRDESSRQHLSTFSSELGHQAADTFDSICLSDFELNSPSSKALTRVP
ncbi:hypothetical protein CDAR_103941 [Caerostris darwini]|uniref:Uncharacterized protein n=1 Tax=Caerostris darwini TaxID=1538125 RepID=A0AAV4SYM6_9ARAC|nr:hypothetical protein CDAR_103941 [Caerostris darwini]